MKVCFVCLGNICRSPMAEGLYQKRIRDLGLSHLISVESRATSSYEIGRPPHPGTAKILRRENAELVGKKAQRISMNDVEEFDIIIGMDQDNVNDLKRIAGKHHIRFISIEIFIQIQKARMFLILIIRVNMRIPFRLFMR